MTALPPDSGPHPNNWNPCFSAIWLLLACFSVLLGGCSGLSSESVTDNPQLAANSADRGDEKTALPSPGLAGSDSILGRQTGDLAAPDTMPPEFPLLVDLTLPPAPDGCLPLAQLEALYRQVLTLLASENFDQAQDLIFLLQDQVLAPLPADADSLYIGQRRSLGRRLVMVDGLIAEGHAFASSPASADSLLAWNYTKLTTHTFPDSLVPIQGTPHPTLTADLLRIENARVAKWIKYFTGDGRRHFSYWLDRKAAADSLVRSILRAEDLPPELIYLAMIESGLSPYARSSVGAVGPWQFMPGTAKRYNLRTDWWVDERRDLAMSTRAACAYLKRLYSQFSDWALVLAAYNSGENRITRSMRLSGHDDYWRLHLPSQTADFVPKFIAAARIGEDPERYGFTVTEVPSLAFEEVLLDDATDLELVARCAGVNLKNVLELNPGLKRRASPPDSPSYPVRVPVGTAAICHAELRKIPSDQRLTWRRHKVNKGETLSEIASQYGTTVNDIAQLNNVKSVHLIRPGDQLLIPMPATLAAKARQRAQDKGHYVPPDGYQRVSYRVKKGDTLSGIALKLGVSLNHLRRVNGLYKSSLIKPGQKLYAYRPAGADARGT